MAVLFDTYFVFKYLSQLETGSRLSKKEDLVWYLMVVGSVIIVGQAFFVIASISRDLLYVSPRPMILPLPLPSTHNLPLRLSARIVKLLNSYAVPGTEGD